MISSPNRLVAIATPLIFAPLAGLVSTWAAQQAPGANLDAGQLEAVFIAGATIALAKAGLWMKGWQEHEKRQEAVSADSLDDADVGAETFDSEIGDQIDPAAHDVVLDEEVDDVDLDHGMAEFEAALADNDAMTAQEV